MGTSGASFLMKWEKKMNEIMVDIEAVLAKHGVSQLDKPRVLGVALHRLGNCHVRNDFDWGASAFVADYLFENGCDKTIRQIAEMFPDKHTYCDNDCHVKGRVVIVNQECLECDSMLARIRDKIKDGVCARCGDTKIDPEYKHIFHCVLYRDHGYTYFFYTTNRYANEIHCRYFGESWMKEKAADKLFDKLCVAASKPKYESDCDHLRYLDSRDDGYVFSLEKSPHDDYRGDVVDARAVFAATIITEHFPCLLKGEDDE